MAEGESYGPRIPPAIEQLQWSEQQAEKRFLYKMEALLNEYIGRVVRFLGIHGPHGPQRPPKPDFERSERRLDLSVRAARNMGLNDYADAVKVLHENLEENFDKFAPPIRHALDTPKPGEPATELVARAPTDKDILDRLQRK